MRRLLALPAALLLAAACAARSRVPAPPAAFPLATVWTVSLPALVEGPLATDGERVFVATRDGDVHAVDAASGTVSWKASSRGGVLGFGEGLLVARAADGTVWGLDPATGSARWKAASGVPGTVPPLVDQGRVFIAGEGLVALSRGRGQELWSGAPAAVVTTPPLTSGPWVFTGESDGVLRARDVGSGASLWTLKTGNALRAPLAIDDHRLLVGTTSDRFLSVDAAKGRTHWRWRVGADVHTGAVAIDGRVYVATHEAVLYALKRGSGAMVWRAPLPSRPLAGPILYGKTLLVTCAESQIVGFDLLTGKRRGDLQIRVAEEKTTPVVRTTPLVLGNRLYVGTSNPAAVLAFELGAAPPPSESPSPGQPTPSPSPASGPAAETKRDP